MSQAERLISYDQVLSREQNEQVHSTILDILPRVAKPHSLLIPRPHARIIGLSGDAETLTFTLQANPAPLPYQFALVLSNAELSA